MERRCSAYPRDPAGFCLYNSFAIWSFCNADLCNDFAFNCTAISSLMTTNWLSSNTVNSGEARISDRLRGWGNV